MGDLFHERVPDEFIARVWAAMWAAGPNYWLVDDPLNYAGHTFQILTKRPERMKSLLTSDYFCQMVVRMGFLDLGPTEPVPFIWLGVSCENQVAADERIPLLVGTPAAVRFVSLEPLLGLVNLSGFMPSPVGLIPKSQMPNWVIVGAESGPGARPMKLEWAESIVAQCRSAGVAVWVKQLYVDGKFSKNMEEWPKDLRTREFPKV